MSASYFLVLVEHSLPFDVKEKHSTLQYYKDWIFFFEGSQNNSTPEATLIVFPTMVDYLQVINTLRVHLSIKSSRQGKENISKFSHSYPQTKIPPHFQMNRCTNC